MTDQQKKQMPKGGRKGGKQFPHIGLEEAVKYAKGLVRKTHTGPQPSSIILTGVFGSGASSGKIRAAALKQYGLLEGTSDAYIASSLAKSIVHAPPEELNGYLQDAFLKPEVFKGLYETFKGDNINFAKIRQQASNLEVHPDNLEKCTALFTASLQFAGLGKVSEDEVEVISSEGSPEAQSLITSDECEITTSTTSEPDGNRGEIGKPLKSDTASDTGSYPEKNLSARSVIQVNIDLDSSLDTEKLEKQLELLRRYGAI